LGDRRVDQGLDDIGMRDDIAGAPQ